MSMHSRERKGQSVAVLPAKVCGFGSNVSNAKSTSAAMKSKASPVKKSSESGSSY